MKTPTPPRKSLTVEMGGFAELIDALVRIPRDVKKALPLIERGQLTKGNDILTAALVHVELAKAAILSNLAFAAMKEGDVGKCTGYVDIAVESLTELGLESTEIGAMLALVLANLPADPPSPPTETSNAG